MLEIKLFHDSLIFLGSLELYFCFLCLYQLQTLIDCKHPKLFGSVEN
jgi:hypothetical protein